MHNQFLSVISLRNSGGILSLLLLTSCTTGASIAGSFVATNPGTATNEQLTGCRDHVGQAFAQVPYADINVYAGTADNQGNTTVNWQLKNGTSGYCQVDSFNNVTQFVVNSNSGTPTPSPSPSPSPTPSPPQAQFDPQSLVGRNLDEAIATANGYGYSVTDTTNPNRIYLSNNEQQIIIDRDPSTNTVTNVAVVRAPSPSPSPSAFDPQSLVGLGRDEAIRSAEANGYTVTDDTNSNQIVLSNGQQQITLTIGRLFNRVNSVAVATAPTPAPTPSPSPNIGNNRDQVLAQLESCRNYVGGIYQSQPANVNVYAGAPDGQGNTIVNWQVANTASGFCRMDGLNPAIAQFVVEQENIGQSQQPSGSGRPTVNGLW